MGRPKGSTNKGGLTPYTRETFRLIWERLSPRLEDWIARVAVKNPATAAGLLLQMAEYHVPKLARNEVVGVEDKPVSVVIRINQDDDGGVGDSMDAAKPEDGTQIQDVGDVRGDSNG